MRKKLIIILLLVFLFGCKKVSNTTGGIENIGNQIAAVKDSAAEAISQSLNNSGQPSQIVYLPPEQQMMVQQNQVFQSNDVISKDYRPSCMLQKYRFLNSYCGAKAYWNKQSTLLSWYLPYWFVLGMLFLAILFFIWWLWSRGKG